MKKKQLLTALSIILATLPAGAWSFKDDLVQNTSFGGYAIGKVSATTNDAADKKADIAMRLVRLYVDSRLGDFAMRLQMHLNGNTSGVNGPRLIDAWVEWQHWKEMRVKFGQFKRPFTFENPMHPFTLGEGTYSQLADRLAGFNDRTGEHASAGRDVGLQLQGDLFASARDGHRWLHYQVGVFSGQGINFADRNTRKDVIGGLWVAPLAELQVGVFGWTGNYVDGNKVTHERRRYAVGAKYEGRWTARAEFAVDNADGKADAWYAIVGTPSWHRTRLFAHYDVYRDAKCWDCAKSLYGLSLQHTPHPNFMLQANWAFADDRAAADRHYHNVDIQVYFRF
ncbi:MAG: porin [Bacteroidaceae bacterium]|nr:porin [Bacteroidaceae bacterium]